MGSPAPGPWSAHRVFGEGGISSVHFGLNPPCGYEREHFATITSEQRPGCHLGAQRLHLELQGRAEP